MCEYSLQAYVACKGYGALLFCLAVCPMAELPAFVGVCNNEELTALFERVRLLGSLHLLQFAEGIVNAKVYLSVAFDSQRERMINHIAFIQSRHDEV